VTVSSERPNIRPYFNESVAVNDTIESWGPQETVGPVARSVAVLGARPSADYWSRSDGAYVVELRRLTPRSFRLNRRASVKQVVLWDSFARVD
jgi:hypothetical protein